MELLAERALRARTPAPLPPLVQQLRLRLLLLLLLLPAQHDCFDRTQAGAARPPQGMAASAGCSTPAAEPAAASSSATAPAAATFDFTSKS